MTREIIATLPNASIEKGRVSVEVVFEYTVPTVFGDLTIQTVPADGDNATHKKLQISYSVGFAKPANLLPINLQDDDVTYDYTTGTLTFKHNIPSVLRQIPGEFTLIHLDNTYLSRTWSHETNKNIQVMNSTGTGEVDAIKDTFHSFIWKGKNILVRIDTIQEYCITITPCSSLPVDPLRVDPLVDPPPKLLPTHLLTHPLNYALTHPLNHPLILCGIGLEVAFLWGFSLELSVSLQNQNLPRPSTQRKK